MKLNHSKYGSMRICLLLIAPFEAK